MTVSVITETIMVRTIDAAELADLLAESNVDLIDVRDADEWESGHVAGSRVIPLETFRADPEAYLSPNTKLIFMCAKGVRSMAAAKIAERFGYEAVCSLDGGIKSWAAQGMPVMTATRVAA
jgi:rhodanese-related sulfurtransferase